MSTMAFLVISYFTAIFVPPGVSSFSAVLEVGNNMFISERR